jgi:ABC-2 type transport system permease protein
MGLVGGFTYSLVIGYFGIEFWQILIMGLSKIPAVWILIGVFSLLYGYAPKFSSLSWGVWGLFSILEVAWEGRVIGWDIMKLSPFSFAHYTIQIKNLSILSLIVILLISLALIALGMFGYRRRDILTKA